MGKTKTAIIALAAALAVIAVVHMVRMHPAEVDPDMDALKSVPYLTWAPTGDSGLKSGVISYDSTLSWPGVNLYNSRNLASADLIAMDGSTVHTWAARIRDDDTWHHV